jgi:hypothetical protein
LRVSVKSSKEIVVLLHARADALRCRANARITPLVTLDKRCLTDRQRQAVNAADADRLAAEELDRIIAEIGS